MHHFLTRSYNLHKILMILCFMILPALTSGCKKKEEPPPEPVQDTRPIMRIAFVGNEYTMANNLLNMFYSIAQTDPSAQFRIKVGLHTLPEATLAELWKTPKTKKVFTPNKWDYVIVQPHHMWAATEGHVYNSQRSINVWARHLTDVGTMPVLFMTWPLERSNAAYSDLKYRTSLKNYKHMHRMIRGYSKAISKKNDMLLIPIGDYWMHAINTAPHINLYKMDGSTPSPAGTYLTALVIYKTLVDNTLDDIVYAPPQIDEETKKALIAIASAKVED